MTIVSVQLSPADNKALRTAMADPQEWVENLLTNRARILKQEIYDRELPGIIARGDFALLAQGIDAVVMAADLTPPEPEPTPLKAGPPAELLSEEL